MQGNPLSPMLFLLAMEPLHRLFKRAQDLNLLDSVVKSCKVYIIPLYVDDAALLIRPSEKDLLITNHILDIFVEASGLVTNLNKTEFYPIQCNNIDLDFLTSRNYALSSFPCKYLGFPLHYRKPSKAMVEVVIQKIGNRLPEWKRGLVSYPGRESLVKVVLSSIPTYFLTVFKMRKCAISRIDKYRRSFL
jgi:hypothetical protein